MNYAKLLFLHLICASFSLAAHSGHQLDWKEINQKSVVIERKAVRDSYLLAAVTALGYAQSIHALIVFFTAEAPEKPTIPFCEPCQKKAQLEIEKRKNTPFLESVAANAKEFGYFAKNLFTTAQGWGSMGKLGLYYAGQLSALFFMSKVAEDLTHPDTLRWYVYVYVPYQATINDMKEAILELSDESLDARRVKYNQQLLKDSFDRIARYGESIGAYMLYKSRWLDVLERPVAERAAHYLFNYHNDWLARVFAHSESPSPHYNKINKLIVAYEDEIAGQLRHFSAIEGETKAERRAVRDRG